MDLRACLLLRGVVGHSMLRFRRGGEKRSAQGSYYMTGCVYFEERLLRLVQGVAPRALCS